MQNSKCPRLIDEAVSSAFRSALISRPHARHDDEHTGAKFNFVDNIQYVENVNADNLRIHARSYKFQGSQSKSEAQ